MLDPETVVGSGTMKVVCSREELTQKLAVVSRGASTLLETSNQTFHPGTGWATETMRSRCCTSTLIDGEIKSGNERARRERYGYNGGTGYPDAEQRQRLQDQAAMPFASAVVAAAGRGPLGD